MRAEEYISATDELNQSTPTEETIEESEPTSAPAEEKPLTEEQIEEATAGMTETQKRLFRIRMKINQGRKANKQEVLFPLLCFLLLLTFICTLRLRRNSRDSQTRASRNVSILRRSLRRGKGGKELAELEEKRSEDQKPFYWKLQRCQRNDNRRRRERTSTAQPSDGRPSQWRLAIKRIARNWVLAPPLTFFPSSTFLSFLSSTPSPSITTVSSGSLL